MSDAEGKKNEEEVVPKAEVTDAGDEDEAATTDSEVKDLKGPSLTEEDIRGRESRSFHEDSFPILPIQPHNTEISIGARPDHDVPSDALRARLACIESEEGANISYVASQERAKVSTTNISGGDTDKVISGTGDEDVSDKKDISGTGDEVSDKKDISGSGDEEVSVKKEISGTVIKDPSLSDKTEVRGTGEEVASGGVEERASDKSKEAGGSDEVIVPPTDDSPGEVVPAMPDETISGAVVRDDNTKSQIAPGGKQQHDSDGALESSGYQLAGEVPGNAKLDDSDAMIIEGYNKSDLDLGSLSSTYPRTNRTQWVTIDMDDGSKGKVSVEVCYESSTKRFVGGWRHKLTGVQYLNAYVQTVPKKYVPSSTPKNCRDTQTVRTKNVKSQTKSDTSTQMTKTGCWVSDREDKIIIPGTYVTADEKFEKMLSKVIILQSYFRQWKAKRYVESVRQDHIRRIEWEKREEERKRRDKERRLKEEYQRRMHPLSKEDFDLVYHALELWRREEVEHINATKSGPERKAALAGLMDEETELIASIERHKLVARKENNKRSKQKFLDKCAAPKKWIGFDGMPTQMDTPNTTRAKDLKETYESLDKRYLTREERLDVLLQLKLTVKEHDCRLTKDIVELIDREADLLMRGTKERNLEGLRQRISTLFLQYIKTPLFNPEAANLIKVPQDPSTLRKNIYYCRGCGSYLPSTEFELSTNARGMGRCRKCKKLESEGRLREDFSKYRSLLHQIRQIEEGFNDGSRIIFLMTEADLRYLTENIWGAQSVLSQWEDTYDLTLVRWNRRVEWSPWNCILLTNEEARAHAKLVKPEEAYGPSFTQKIKYRHILARQYFSTLPRLGDYMSNHMDSVTMPLPSNAEKVMYATRQLLPETSSNSKGSKEPDSLELPPLNQSSQLVI